MRHSILNRLTALLCAGAVFMPLPVFAAAPPEMKQEAAGLVDKSAKQIQQMIDQVFSFAEPGYQEIRTSAYLTGILEKNGFKPVGKDGYVPQKGDIVVMQPVPGAKDQSGHIAVFNGKQWVSDFKQSGIWPGPGYRQAKPPYKIYRQGN